MIGIGIVGCGKIAEIRHIPEYATNGNCRIVGLYDSNRDRAEALVAQFGGQVFDSLESLLACKEIDAISVCTSNDTHAQIAIQAMRAGKHVLCEKPMAMNVAEAEAMVKTAQETGRQLMIGQNQRLAPAHQLVKKLLTSGKLGEILSFQATFAHGGPEGWLKEKTTKSIWFFDKKKLPAGVLADLGIHKIDLICWFFRR